ncbi:MAG: restriction endonuclease subunit S [bacterium]
MKKILLTDIADMFTGIVLPKEKNLPDSPFEKNPKREYRIINISDIDDDSNISKSLMEIKLDDSSRVTKYLVKYNNILISSRGTKLKTAIVPMSVKNNTLISSNLICIQMKEKADYPSEILNFFLRSVYGENALKKLSESSEGVVNLNQRVLSLLEVPLFEDAEERERMLNSIKAMNEIKNLFVEQRNTFLTLAKTIEGKYLEKYESESE